VGRSIQVHRALGITTELDLVRMFLVQYVTGFSDGPSEIRQAHRTPDPPAVQVGPRAWPTEHLPTRRAAAEAHVAARLAATGFAELT
jgi:acyl-CoA dehydrogenase